MCFVSFLRTIGFQALRITQKVAFVLCVLGGFPSSVFVLFFLTFFGDGGSSLTYQRIRSARSRIASLIASYCWAIGCSLQADAWVFPWMNEDVPHDYFVTRIVAVILAVVTVFWIIVEVGAAKGGIELANRVLSRYYIIIAHMLITPTVENFFDATRLEVWTDFSASKRWPFGGYYVLLCLASIIFPLFYAIFFSVQGMWIRKETNPYVYRWLLEEMSSVTSDLCKEYHNRFWYWPILALMSDVLLAIFSGLGYLLANVALNFGMIAIDIVARPHLFGSGVVVDAGTRLCILLGDVLSYVFTQSEPGVPPFVLGVALVVLACLPLVVAFIWFLVFEWSDAQRQAAFENSLHIEIDITALRGRDITPVDLGPDVKIDPDVIKDEARTLFIADSSDHGDGSEDSDVNRRSDEDSLGELVIRPPRPLQGRAQEPLSDDSFDGAELLDAVHQGHEEARVRRAEAANAKFKEDIDTVPIPVPPRPPNATPLPVLRKVPRPKRRNEWQGSQMAEIRQVLQIAKDLGFKYRDLNNQMVRYDDNLVKRFKMSSDANIFQEINDVVAQRVLYFAFGVVFFVGVFIVTHAWSLVAVDTVAVHVYPRSIQEFEEQFGELDRREVSTSARRLSTSRLPGIRGITSQNETASVM
jgi:hypothetical protein